MEKKFFARSLASQHIIIRTKEFHTLNVVRNSTQGQRALKLQNAYVNVGRKGKALSLVFDHVRVRQSDSAKKL